jgi:hypothetical protein
VTIANEVDSQFYAGNGTAVEFPVPFKIFSKEDLRVILIDADGVEDVQALDTDYTIEDSDVGTVTGKVTFTDAPEIGHTILIRRFRDLSQDTRIRDNSNYNPGIHESALDAQVMHSQRLAYDLKRCLRILEAEGEGVAQLPSAQDRANRYLRFDSDGNIELTSSAAVLSPKMWVREGNLTTGSNDRFAFWRALENESYTRMDVQVSDAPTGGDLVIELIKNGTETVGSVTVPAGEDYAIEVGLEIDLEEGDYVRPEITLVGTSTPGASATIRMLP